MIVIKEVEVICDICKKTITLSYLKYTTPGYQQTKEIEERLKEAGWETCHSSKKLDCCESCKKRKEIEDGKT